ncbi:MAG: arginine--tRNA ligase, partial [Christensenellales bacterium]
TVIGAALYRIYKALGYKVVGINHLGDWGTQFGKLITAYKLWGDEKDVNERSIDALLELYVRFHKAEKEDPSLGDTARAWFKKIEDGDGEALTLFNWFKELTLKKVGKIYERLNITFDSYAGESFYNDKMQPVLDELKRDGLLTESDGAQVVDLSEYGMPPCLLVKADGATLYATRDLAAAMYRKKTYDFSKCLYVVAYQQNLHFKQWFKVVELMGYPWAKDLVHVAFGMVSLEGSALSTREGHVVFLEEVLDKTVEKALEIVTAKNPELENKRETAEKIGVGAVVFFALSNNRIKDITFSYDKVLNFDGETGPYVQYTVARCNSVIAKGGECEGECDFSAVTTPEGNELVSYLMRFPEVVRDAAKQYEPSLITRHIVDIAEKFNKFYYENKILDDRTETKNARIMLTRAVKTVLSKGLALLGIDTVEKM